MKDLKLNLIIQALDKATAPLRNVAGALDHVREHTEKLQHAMHKLGLAEFIGGAFFTGVALEAGHAVFELTDHVAEMGEAMLRGSEKTSVSVEALQRWTWAAKQLGVESDSLNHAFAMMELHVGNAVKGNKESGDALKLIGVSMKEVRALSSDPGALFSRIIAGFQRIKNPAAQAVAAQGIFSRSWQEMAPLLKAPREEIDELMGQLKKAHLVMTTEDAEAAKKFEQNKGNMGLAVQGLSWRIGNALMPKLSQVMQKMADWIESISDDSINQFADAISKLADDFTQLLPLLQKLALKAVDLADRLLKLSDNTGVVKGVFVALAGVLTAQAIVAIVSTGASIVGVGMAAVRAGVLIAELIPAITGLTDVMAVLSIAMDANPIGVIVLAIGALIGVVALLILGIMKLHDHWDEITTFMEDGCKKIEKAFADLESKMPKWLQKVLNAGGALLSIQFPALGALGAGIDALARAPRPAPHSPAPNPSAPHQSAPKPPHGATAPAQFPGLLKLFAGIDTVAPASAPAETPAPAAAPESYSGDRDGEVTSANPAALAKFQAVIQHEGRPPRSMGELNSWLHATPPGWVDGNPFRVASPARVASSPPPATESASKVLGTIIVKAEPGTSIKRIEKSGGIDFSFNRGRLPA
jgi:hypothetical protein